MAQLLQTYRDIQPGRKKLVMFTHGWTGSGRVWEQYKNQFPDSDVVILTLPGHACTTEAEWLASNASQWLGAAEETLKQYLGKYSEIALVGHSMGGLISAYLAYRYPVTRLVLCAPAFEAKDITSRFTGLLRFFVKRVKQNAEDLAYILANPDLPQAEKDSYRDVYMKYIYTKQAWELQKLMNMMRKYVANFKGELNRTLEVLVIWASNDEAINQKTVWKFLENLHRDFTIDIYTYVMDSGHHTFMMHDEGHDTLDFIVDFIQKDTVHQH